VSFTTWEADLPAATASARVRVYLPSLDDLIEHWPEIAPMLQRATSRTGCYTPNDVLALAMLGQAGIWVCEVDDRVVASIVTKVERYPRKNILEIMFAGGSQMRHWLSDAVATIDRHALACGCAHVAGVGRPGWVRAWGGEATGDVIIVRDLKAK
jgi:hypothetical protein